MKLAPSKQLYAFKRDYYTMCKLALHVPLFMFSPYHFYPMIMALSLVTTSHITCISSFIIISPTLYLIFVAVASSSTAASHQVVDSSATKPKNHQTKVMYYASYNVLSRALRVHQERLCIFGGLTASDLDLRWYEVPYPSLLL